MGNENKLTSIIQTKDPKDKKRSSEEIKGPRKNKFKDENLNDARFNEDSKIESARITLIQEENKKIDNPFFKPRE